MSKKEKAKKGKKIKMKGCKKDREGWERREEKKPQPTWITYKSKA